MSYGMTHTTYHTLYWFPSKNFLDRVISSNLVQYSVEDDCYKINDLAAAKFLGHSTRDFILESTFDKFNPSWVQAQLREDVSPK